VLIGVGAEGLVQLLDQVGVLAIEGMALSVGSLLLNGIEVKGGVGCAVVVAVVSQAVVLADQNAAAAARKLDCAELCLVVLCDGRGDVGDQT
jgi:hypothetical protein